MSGYHIQRINRGRKSCFTPVLETQGQVEPARVWLLKCRLMLFISGKCHRKSSIGLFRRAKPRQRTAKIHRIKGFKIVFAFTHAHGMNRQGKAFRQ